LLLRTMGAGFVAQLGTDSMRAPTVALCFAKWTRIAVVARRHTTMLTRGVPTITWLLALPMVSLDDASICTSIAFPARMLAGRAP
jgi:hypothetical protein